MVLVEDHAVVREGTRELLQREDGIEVVGEASTGAEAVTLARRLVPSLMVVDVELPDKSGVGVVREVVEAGLPVRCLMLSAHDDYVFVAESLAAGVRAVATGVVVVDQALSRRLAGRLRHLEQLPAGLTSREFDVVRALVRGRSNKEIASELGVGLRTVESYVSNVLSKFGVRSRTEAIVYAIAHHLASAEAG